MIRAQGRWLRLLAVLHLLAWSAGAVAGDSGEGYSAEEILTRAERFLGDGARGLGEVVEKLFAEKGRPNAYIEGEEAGGAIGVGVRYGKGTLVMRDGRTRTVYWRGPSLGFDLGASAARVFVLVYHLQRPEDLYQRFPGVEGSLYFVAGIGAHYLQSGELVLAPIRLGVGWRQGANVGYMQFSPRRDWNPF